jgi:hypothetical protein
MDFDTKPDKTVGLYRQASAKKREEAPGGTSSLKSNRSLYNLLTSMTLQGNGICVGADAYCLGRWRGTAHCASGIGCDFERMAEGSRAIRLAWMEVDSPTGRVALLWQAQQPDGSCGQETATVEPGEGHPLLERCKEAVADFARRARGPATDS